MEARGAGLERQRQGQPSGWAASHVCWELEFVEFGGRMADDHAGICEGFFINEGFFMLCPAGDLVPTLCKPSVFLRFIDLETEMPRLND